MDLSGRVEQRTRSLTEKIKALKSQVFENSNSVNMESLRTTKAGRVGKVARS